MKANLERSSGESSERFALPAHAFAAIRRALAEVALTKDAKTELRRYLALAAAFDGELESPGVAQRMRALLAVEPLALSVVQLQIIEKQSIDETRRFKLREGREVDLEAPVHDHAPARGVPLRELFDLTGFNNAPRVRRAR